MFPLMLQDQPQLATAKHQYTSLGFIHAIAFLVLEAVVERTSRPLPNGLHSGSQTCLILGETTEPELQAASHLGDSDTLAWHLSKQVLGLCFSTLFLPFSFPPRAKGNLSVLFSSTPLPSQPQLPHQRACMSTPLPATWERTQMTKGQETV